MSIFKHLGEAPANLEPLSPDIESDIDEDLLTSWGRVPEAWKSTITQEQVAAFLEGVAAKVIRRYPNAPPQPLILYLLTKAKSVLTGGGGGSSGGGGGTTVNISASAGNLIEMYSDGLYATLRKVDGGTFN